MEAVPPQHALWVCVPVLAEGGESSLHGLVPCLHLCGEALERHVRLDGSAERLEHGAEVHHSRLVYEVFEEPLCLKQCQADRGAELKPVTSAEVIRGRRTRLGSNFKENLHGSFDHLTGFCDRAVGLAFCARAPRTTGTRTAPAYPARLPALQLSGLGLPPMLWPPHEFQRFPQVLRADADANEATPQLPEQGFWRDVNKCVEELREGDSAVRVCVHHCKELLGVLLAHP
mmetsp:Transcript_135550/g.377490  ORF Transcript_135550/g.377490 Transcript_135550/m.377490 type:complete len:230 (+) Transcript_135550:732-1421(+)